MKIATITYIYNLLISIVLLLGTSTCQMADSTDRNQDNSRGYVAQKAMVVSAHPLASEVGVEILKKGGNAVDAAIAVQFALSVVHPAAGNIGGGGFMIIRRDEGSIFSLDFREKAPLKGYRDMYLDSDGEVIKDLSRTGHLASGVPGVVDGMEKAHQKFGTLEWEDLIQPAIDLARNGFPLTRKEAVGLNINQKAFIEANTISPDFALNEEWVAGDTIQYSDLAETLTRIQINKRAGFYEGLTAELIVAEMQRGGGLISYDDLSSYESIWRDPIVGHYKDYKIISMGPPSAGGISLVQLLHMLEPFPLSDYNLDAAEYIHLLTEAEKRVYADRAKYLGDIDYYDVPKKQLLNRVYNNNRMGDYDPAKAKPSEDIYAGEPLSDESAETTHFSIVDPYGNAVAVTTTLNGGYGSKVFVGGAGFLLNNEMDDFSIKPGTPNMFGLIGGDANAIEPGKRMLSSMTPTIVEKNNDLYMVIGSPGGSKIITSVLQSFLNVVEFGHTMQKAVTYKRFHHQWKPDHIMFESGRMDDEVKEDLLVMGHKLMVRGPYSRVDAILVLENGSFEGGADPRGDDAASGF
jgi:gamma-glutamyltranspeptidase/glutathione hydrolase